MASGVMGLREQSTGKGEETAELQGTAFGAPHRPHAPPDSLILNPNGQPRSPVSMQFRRSCAQVSNALMHSSQPRPQASHAALV